MLIHWVGCSSSSWEPSPRSHRQMKTSSVDQALSNVWWQCGIGECNDRLDMIGVVDCFYSRSAAKKPGLQKPRWQTFEGDVRTKIGHPGPNQSACLCVAGANPAIALAGFLEINFQFINSWAGALLSRLGGSFTRSSVVVSFKIRFQVLAAWAHRSTGNSGNEKVSS